MLHKMYLVSSELIRNTSERQKKRNIPSSYKTKRKKLQSQRAYDKWITMSKRISEEDVTRNAQLKDIAKFMKNVLPESPKPIVQKLENACSNHYTPSVAVKWRVLEYLYSTSAAVETVYESTPKKPKFEIEIDDEEDDHDDVQEVSDFGRKNFGELARIHIV